MPKQNNHFKIKFIRAPASPTRFALHYTLVIRSPQTWVLVLQLDVHPAERAVPAHLAPGGDALQVEGMTTLQHLVLGLLREELDLDGLELGNGDQGVEADGAGVSRFDCSWNETGVIRWSEINR